MRRLLCVLGLGCAVAACTDPPLTCVPAPALDLTCAPLYAPTYDNLFTNTFVPKCGTGGKSCHASEGAQAGLIFDNADDTYHRLLDPFADRIVPGDPSCSVLVERVFSTEARWHMPRGAASLPAPERCALVQWVAAGALRAPPDAALPDAALPDAEAPPDAP
jgi:hypothetical protein